MLEKFNGKVRIVFKQFPLNSHPFALKAAMAALAAKNQGKFAEFHRKLLENYSSIDDAKIQSIAKELHLDMKRFNNELNSAASRTLISADIQNGIAVGVHGTPALFMNGKRIENRNFSSLFSLIETELAKPR